MPAIVVFSRDVSKSSMWEIPLRPSLSAVHTHWRPAPTGVMRPPPVTAARLRDISDPRGSMNELQFLSDSVHRLEQPVGMLVCMSRHAAYSNQAVQNCRRQDRVGI